MSGHPEKLSASLCGALRTFAFWMANGSVGHNFVAADYRSLLISEPSMASLIEALDAKWEGPQPHTLLVAPGGEIVFRHNGKISGEALLAAVLAVMTTAYQPTP